MNDPLIVNVMVMIAGLVKHCDCKGTLMTSCPVDADPIWWIVECHDCGATWTMGEPGE